MATTDISTAPRSFQPAGTAVVANAIGIAAVIGVITLSLLYSGVPIFGPINDLTNAVYGVLFFLLARQIDPLLRRKSAPLATGTLLAATAAMLLTSINSVLVAFGRMHWETGGLYTALGLGFLGIWMIGVQRSGVLNEFQSNGLQRLGAAAGYTMLVGFAAGPLFTGWTVSNSLVLLTYIGAAVGFFLFPIWAFLLGRKLKS